MYSYAVSLGLIDRLAYHLGGVRGQLSEENSPSNELLLAALKFLTSLVFLLHLCQKPAAKKSKGSSPLDSTQLIEAFQVTELAGVINALYGLLLHQEIPTQTGAPELTTYTLRFAVAALQLIHRIAILDLAAFQVSPVRSSLAQFRHTASESDYTYPGYCRCRGRFTRISSHRQFSVVVRCQGLNAGEQLAQPNDLMHRLLCNRTPRQPGKWAKPQRHRLHFY